MKWIFIFSLIFFKSEACDVVCEYSLHEEFNFGYACNVRQLKITSINSRNISKAVGYHLEGRNDISVTIFNSYQKEIQFFPLNLTNIFKNLEVIVIQSGNMKEISLSDLMVFGGRLRFLNLFGNSIEAIEVDLFDFNPNIERINLGGNRIKHVDDGVFSNLRKLNELKFERNPCHSGYAMRASDLSKLIGFIKSFCKNENFVLKREIRSLKRDFEDFKWKMNDCRCLNVV